MQPYQDEYIANLKEITALTARQKPGGSSFEEYLARLLQSRHRAQQLSRRNMELLRSNLFPVLDHLFEAGDKVLKELQEFAGKLLSGREELDTGLYCQIHQALLRHARMRKNREQMIEELYWLGIGRNNLCTKLVGLETSEIEKYTSQMRLCFIEASAYLKYYDEIEDTQTRGYILRSLANRSLGQFKYHNEKIRLTKQTLQVLQDKDYQEKEPDLPWDRYIYMTRQQMTANISHSKNNNMTHQDIADVMESAYIVYQRRLQEAGSRNEKPPVRSAFSYHAINYYCGLYSLDKLLTQMEDLMNTADASDFSTESMYGIISLPAFYCQYLTEYPDKIPGRKTYIENLYQRILDYVEVFPEAPGNESLFFYLRQLSATFLETKDSISYKDFLQKLLIRFAPDTYVHSYVTGKAAMTLCEIIYEEEPDFFDDIDFIRELREPARKRQAVLEYAMECGLFHDAGKLNFISLYSQSGRQWFEDEYEIAHLHTVVGKTHLAARASTCRFAEIAHGHHAWYDGSRGYPDSYRRLDCPLRQMVDIIGLADWFDNVMYTNRTFTGVEMTFEEAVNTAISLEGKRFSPLLTLRLLDKKVTDRLSLVFSSARKEAYLRIYNEESCNSPKTSPRSTPRQDEWQN